VDRAVEHSLGNPGDRARIPDVDNCCSMFRRNPGTQLAVNDAKNLEAEKNPVIGLCSEDEIEFRFDRQLRDFRGTE
jgi:hypothetical protein